MNQSRILLILITIFIGRIAFGQDIEKLNKSELREKILSLNALIDSQNQQISLIEKERNDLIAQKKVLEGNIDLNNTEIEKLKNFAKTVLSEQSELKVKYESQITSLTNEIAKLEKQNLEKLAQQEAIIKELNEKYTRIDSLSKIQDQNISELKISKENLSITDKDFLNDFYLNTPPIQQGLFELKLSKVIYEKIDKSFNLYDYNSDPEYMKTQLGIFRGEISHADPYYDSDGEFGNEKEDYRIYHSIPELLNDELVYFGTKANLELKRNAKLSDYLVLKDVSYFNDALPRIEILRNKLFTLKYPDGREESFLLNVRSTELNNNNRKVVQLELANETVKQEGVNNFSNDVVWKIYSIGNEAFIGLSLFQLRRININIFDPKMGVEVKKNGVVESSYYERWYDFQNEYHAENISYRTSGNGIYFNRIKEKFIVTDQLINPIELIYLFKVKKIE